MWGSKKEGIGKERTPAPTPAMMAIVLDMAVKWEVMVESRMAGFIDRMGTVGLEIYV